VSSRLGWIVSSYWPPVSKIFWAAIVQLAGGDILVSLAATLRRAAIGYAVGSTIGVALGILLGKEQGAPDSPAAADRDSASDTDAGRDPSADPVPGCR
jgi:ABC-type nitrate/sulfonate/bicarbonate transport system permease component